MTAAADGLTGVDAALAERPDVMIVDIGLPALDGWLLFCKAHQGVANLLVVRSPIDGRSIGRLLLS